MVSYKKHVVMLLSLSLYLTTIYGHEGGAVHHDPLAAPSLQEAVDAVTGTMSEKTTKDAPSFDMAQYCDKVMSNATGFYKERLAVKVTGALYKPCMIPLAEFKSTVDTAKTYKEQELAQGRWGDNGKPLEDYDNAYIKKVVLPKDSEIIFFGDLHGSIHSVIRTLRKLQANGYLDQQLRLLKRNTYMVFLGDMVDYGLFGIDTLFTALQLFIRNPEQVFICRGNHEDQMQFNQPRKENTLFVEMTKRFGYNSEVTLVKEAIESLFKQLPYAIFIGIQESPLAGYAQCCHGGFVDAAAIEKTLQRLFQEHVDFVRLEGDSITSKKIADTFATHKIVSCNFNWGNLSGKQSHELTHKQRYSRSAVASDYNKTHAIDEIQAIMAETNVRVIFRGHEDGLNSFKATLPTIHEPVYPLLKIQNKVSQQYYNPQEFDTLRGLQEDHGPIKAVIGTRETLFEHGFTIRDYKLSVSPIAAFTFSCARSAKAFMDEGCGLVKIGETWEDSTVRAYVDEKQDQPEVFEVYKQAYLP